MVWKRNTCRILLGELEGKGLLGRQRIRWAYILGWLEYFKTSWLTWYPLPCCGSKHAVCVYTYIHVFLLVLCMRYRYVQEDWEAASVFSSVCSVFLSNWRVSQTCSQEVHTNRCRAISFLVTCLCTTRSVLTCTYISTCHCIYAIGIYDILQPQFYVVYLHRIKK
jgi:hypothetical protein